MVTIIYILAGVVLLGLCIFVHELGHLLGGKMVGIKAKIFSLGYGKGFIKKTIGDTTYQITLIPLGGYCMFYGEDPSEERSGAGYEFLSAHPAKRMLTVAMGPLFNLFFGIIIFFVMNMVGYTKETNRVYIPESIQRGKYVSAAYKAGIRTGDRLIEINGRRVTSFSDIQTAVLFSNGKNLDVKVDHNGKEKRYLVVPKLAEGSNKYQIGVIPFGTRILIADVVDGSAAYNAGIREMDEIESVNGKAVNSEKAFSEIIYSSADKPLLFKVHRSGKSFNVSITPKSSDLISFQIVEENGAGEIIKKEKREIQSILKREIISVDDSRILNHEELVGKVLKSSGKTLAFAIGQDKFLAKARIEKLGLIGVYHTLAPEKIPVRYSPGEAFVQAFVEPYEFIVMNLKGMGMLIAGKMNVRENLSGPIRIVKIAGDVAYHKGIPDFILLMAKISVILMVMNLLPIPVVDGSMLIFFFIELIRGKPLNEKIMQRIQTVGIVLLIMLGAFIIINDISMLPVIQKLMR
jgi:regulator of sigma E protease